MQSSTVTVATIGIVVTLVTAIVLGGIALFNTLESGQLGNLFKRHTVMMLDKSVEMVERYKNAKGQYPVSLENARAYLKEGEIYPDLDFMGPIRLGERVRHFHYEQRNDGEEYYLFGIGLDGDPFSNDDVYPTSSAVDKSDGFSRLEIGA